MESHDRQIGDVMEGIAYARRPRSIDEPEVGERIGSKPIYQLGRGAGHRGWRAPQPPPARRLLYEDDADRQKEYKQGEEQISRPLAFHAGVRRDDTSIAVEIIGNFYNASKPLNLISGGAEFRQTPPRPHRRRGSHSAGASRSARA